MTFAERFEELCREKHEAPSSLGAQMGFSRGTISKWRHGVCVPSSQSLQRLAEYFGVSSDYLLGKSDIRTVEALKKDEEKAKEILFGASDVPEKAWSELLQFVEETKRKYRLN